MKKLIPILSALAVLLGGPAVADASVLHFQGHAVGPKADPDMKIAFDVSTGQGRPKTISNVTVAGLDYRCWINGDTERDLRFFDTGAFTRKGKFEITEKMPPPASSNDIYGKFAYPKKGTRRKPAVSGWITSEFGYGETLDEYNCLGGEEFTATPKR